MVAWQIYGQKRFCGLQDPQRWAPHDLRMNCKSPEVSLPDELTEADTLCYDMGPGAVVWNAMLTPHWVEAGNQVAMSINLSHGGLRYKGQLCPHEQEHVEYQAAQRGSHHPSRDVELCSSCASVGNGVEIADGKQTYGRGRV